MLKDQPEAEEKNINLFFQMSSFSNVLSLQWIYLPSVICTGFKHVYKPFDTTPLEQRLTLLTCF